jgi:hypothetical protein
MYRADQRVRQASLHRSAVSRLSLQFRTDGHAAEAVQLVKSQADTVEGLRFVEASKRTIEYRGQNDEIVREMKEGEETVHRDAFRLLRGARVTWRVEGEPATIAALEICRLQDGAGSDLRERIEAAVGVVGSPD